MGLYFCTEVDGQLCVFRRGTQDTDPLFDVAAYKKKTGWICVGTPEQQTTLHPQLDTLENRWRHDPLFGRSIRKSTRNVLRKPLGCTDLLATLALIEFQRSLLLLLSKAQLLANDHLTPPPSGEVLVKTYSALVQHMALDSVLWLKKQNKTLLNADYLTQQQGATIWDSIFHAHVRRDEQADAIIALQNAIRYEDNATRHALILRLQSDLQQDRDLLKTCDRLAHMRPLRADELARRGMAELRSHQGTAVQKTISELRNKKAVTAQHYALRLEQSAQEMGQIHSRSA
ncbi:MAG: hypothetical protein AAF701_00220 [Pseudomonadota bacterium]